MVGAGGHARSVLDALRTGQEPLDAVACTDPDPGLHGGTLDGVPIVGDDEALSLLLADGVQLACIGVGGTGDNRPRAALYERIEGLGFDLPTVIHGFTHVATSAQLGPGSVVLAGAVLGAGAIVGANAIVGSGAIVEHDCRIGDHVHLASGCVLGGGVSVATAAHVGLGARILQGRGVGTNAIVGAGAVVVRDVSAGETVVGAPAVRMGAGR
jgi:sugar O-acyltransferase (sialic acid O-acetyltransferase NeuD family)